MSMLIKYIAFTKPPFGKSCFPCRLCRLRLEESRQHSRYFQQDDMCSKHAEQPKLGNLIKGLGFDLGAPNHVGPLLVLRQESRVEGDLKRPPREAARLIYERSPLEESKTEPCLSAE